MKKILLYGCIAATVAVTSCGDTDKSETTTTNEDTAVLVEDPNNQLEAAPVNDTLIADTVTNRP
jgi:hypothetical protein